MTQQRMDFLRLVGAPLIGWLLISASTLTAIPDGWTALILRAGLYYDAMNYTTIAVGGYQKDLLSAFYPLWPLAMHIASLGAATDSITQGWIGSGLALVVFSFSVFYLFKLTERLALASFRPYIFWILILSPLSIFRVLPFTESVFSLLLILLLIDLTSDGNSTFRCAIWASLLSLCRPMFPILAVTSIIVLGYLLARRYRGPLIIRSLATLTGSIVGYIPFGFFCYSRYGDFWKPFTIQTQWGKSFGLHWPLLYAPSVINGSSAVLIWDTIGFYTPLALFALAPMLLHNRLSASFEVRVTFLVCVMIGCGHSAAAFFSADKFMSISRHTLANPLPYLAGLICLQSLPERYTKAARLLLFGFALFSGVFLSVWWLRFVQDRWIG